MIDKKDILVRVMRTPNPLAVKVVVNFPIKQEGKAYFKGKEEAKGHSLFLKLFDLGKISQIHAFDNQITLNYEEGLEDLEEIEKKVKKIVVDLGPSHDPNFFIEKEVKNKKRRENLSEIHKKAEEILDRTIRPGLQADGGDLEIISFEGNEVKISYEGACGGCPSAYMGTLEAIENILRYELQNEEIEVLPVEEAV